MQWKWVVVLLVLFIIYLPITKASYVSIHKNPQITGWATVTKTITPQEAIMYDIEAGVNFTVNLTIRGVDITAIDVVMLMDTSGSMADNDPNAVRVQAAKEFVNMLEDHANQSGFYSRVAVVDFDDDAVLLQSLTTDYSAVRNALDQCADANGGTNFEAAISAGNNELINNGDPQHPMWAEILLTDGEDNGYNFWDDVEYAAQHGIRIYTIGFGNPDSNTLQQIAQQTGGKYYYCSSPSDISSAYQDIYNELIAHPAIVNVTSTTPMVEEVFPPYVEFVHSSLPPGNVSQDSSGNTHVFWYIPKIMVDKEWSVEYEIKVFKYGHGPPYDDGVWINAMDSQGNCLSTLRYRNYTSNTTLISPLPNLRVFVHGPPVVYISASKNYTVVNEFVKFFNRSANGWYYSFDPDDEIVKYRWDFGDGQWTETTVGEVSHAYSSPGNYTVTLTAFDVDNLSKSVSLTIRVYPSLIKYTVAGHVKYDGQVVSGADVKAFVNGSMLNATTTNEYGFYYMEIYAKIGSNLTVVANYSNTTAQNSTILGEDTQVILDININSVPESGIIFSIIYLAIFAVAIRKLIN